MATAMKSKRGDRLQTVPVRSRSTGDTHNVVRWSNGEWTCACKGWIFKYQKLGVNCYHIDFALAKIEWAPPGQPRVVIDLEDERFANLEIG